MRRFLALVVAVVAACSSSTTTTTSGATPSTSTPSSTPTTTSTPVGEQQGLEPPELPDPQEVAEEPLRDLELDDFELDDVDPDLLERVQIRLNLFGSLSLASVWEELVSDVGDEVVAFSIYPVAPARGDPALAEALAEGIVEAGPSFDPPEERQLEGGSVFEVIEDGTRWLVWANNTHLFVTAGEDAAPAAVMEEIIALTSGTEYQWSAGDCLYFADGVPYAPFGEGNLVDCDGPHQWEVMRSEPLPEDQDSEFPGDELGERVGAACEEAFFEFTGVLPIDSALNQVFYLPDEAEWEEGDRYFACLVAENDGSGGARLRTGTLEGESTVVARSIGDCYRRFVDVDEVDCGEAHVFEFVGMAQLSGDDYPGGTELSDAAEEACQDLLDGFVSVPQVEGAEVMPFPLGFSRFGWDRGLRETPCFAYAVDDEAAVEVVGSFGDSWGPLGEVDGAIQV